MVWAAAADAAEIVYPADAGHLDVTQFGAVGDGVTDDTAAIQSALDAAGWRRLVYFPDGVYRVSDALRTRTDTYGFVLLQGQSRDGVVVQLAEGTFPDPAAPGAVIDFGNWYSADAFANSVENLTIEVTPDNAGARGLRFFSNNVGRVGAVTIRSVDGAGAIGLELGYNDMNGPLLVKDVRVEGFDYGITTAGAVNSQTLEHITLVGQSIAGLDNWRQALSIRGFTSVNSVPALRNLDGWGNVVVVDADLTGGDPALPGIENWGTLLIRDVETDGYGRVVDNFASAVAAPAGSAVTEWVSEPVLRLFDEGPAATLRLPVQETPTPPADPVEDWVNVMDYGAVNQYFGPDSSAAFQAAIDSGARTIYLPAGDFTISERVEIRGNVERIVAVGSAQLLMCLGAPNAGLRVMDEPNGPDPVFLDDVMMVACDAEEVLVNEGSRALVVRDGSIGGVQTGTGDLFLEDVVTTGALQLTGQTVWARQLNPEPQGLHVANDGGALWVLGLKTERGGVLIDAGPGSATEVLGGFVYTTTSPEGDPMFRLEDGEMSVSIRETNFGGYYGDWQDLVAERQGGDARVLSNTDAPQPAFGSALPLYVSKRADPPPPADTATTGDTGTAEPPTTEPAPTEPVDEIPAPVGPDGEAGCGCAASPTGAAASWLPLVAARALLRRRIGRRSRAVRAGSQAASPAG